MKEIIADIRIRMDDEGTRCKRAPVNFSQCAYMSEKYKFHDQDGIYFVTLTIVHWIDLFPL